MQYHAPSGLYLTKYRAYDPQSGRWLSRDPIEEAGGISLYAYVGGNPVSFVDPLGLAKICRRPLMPGGTPLPLMPGNGNLDMGVFHEHIFFEDGFNPSNIGYGPTGLFTETNPATIDLYECLPGDYVDEYMRQAVQKAEQTGHYTAENYFLPGESVSPDHGSNCQNFVTRVLSEYNAIVNPPLQYSPSIPGGGLLPAWP
jgi:type VI secretion system secreted protein VgrG